MWLRLTAAPLNEYNGFAWHFNYTQEEKYENSQIEKRLLNRCVCVFISVYPIWFFFLEGCGVLRILPCSPSVFMPFPEVICGVDVCLAKGVWMRVFTMYHCWSQISSNLMERFSPQCLFMPPHLFFFKALADVSTWSFQNLLILGN